MDVTSVTIDSAGHGRDQSTFGAADSTIEALQAEVRRIGRLIGRLATEREPSVAHNRQEPPSPFIDDHRIERARADRDRGITVADQPTVTAAQVRTILQQRRLRDEHFEAELFADPAWDMMLDLYAAWLDRKRVSVSSLCIAAAVPATTALRWIKLMEAKGHLVRTPDLHDARRIYVALSNAALVEMHRYFARLPRVPNVI